VALVEQALLTVAEGAAEQREPDAGVGDVRNRCDHDAVLGDQRAHALQQRGRVAQVLEHVGKDDRVEALGAELGLEVELLRVADEHALGVGGRELRRLRIEFDPDDGRSAPVPQACDMYPEGAAELEHARAGLDQLEHHRVRRARAVVERPVTGLDAGVAEGHAATGTLSDPAPRAVEARLQVPPGRPKPPKACRLIQLSSSSRPSAWPGSARTSCRCA